MRVSMEESLVTLTKTSAVIKQKLACPCYSMVAQQVVKFYHSGCFVVGLGLPPSLAEHSMSNVCVRKPFKCFLENYSTEKFLDLHHSPSQHSINKMATIISSLAALK